jgi:membrane-associated phospholipid phosphatase
MVRWRALLLAMALASTVSAQRLESSLRSVVRPVQIDVRTNPGLWHRRDVLRTGGWLALTALAFPIDARVNRWSQRTSVQESSALDALSRVGDVTGSYVALGLGPALWGAGALSADSGMRVMGQRTTEAVALSFLATGAIKVIAGRSRPYASGDRATWSFARGLRTDSIRSFSSGHTALSTAAAITLAAEWRRQGVKGWRSVGPPLVYALAGVAGGSRIRDRQHWASDVMMGAAVGTVSALVVRRWHDHRAR